MRGRKKNDATRTAIVNCAAEIFAQHDFHEVLTDDIAHRLGIGKGTIYRYFRSKEELYLAAIRDGLSGLRAAVDRVLQEDADLTATIEALAGTLISYFWQRRDFFVLLHRLEAKLSAEERADWERSRSEVVGMVAKRLQDAAASGTIAAIEPRLAVEALFGMIRGVCVYRAESDRPRDLTQVVTRIFLYGLAVVPSSAGAVRRLEARPGNDRRS